MSLDGPIVVGTDGSDRAERAVERAGQIAQTLRVKVHVVSGYRPASDAGWMMVSVAGVAPSGQSSDGEPDRERAQHYADRAQRRLSDFGVSSETHVLPGEPAEALITVADSHDAQMIVVGNRGMSGARRILGSVPNHVSHHASCGVLIVPTG